MMSKTRMILVTLACVGLAWPLADAHAQSPAKAPEPEAPPQGDTPDSNDAPLKNRAPITTEKLRPWAEGVPTDKQKAALQLFQKGNKLLRDSLFIKAAKLYREALANWDHPAIHYNLALALITLDEPVQVYKSLERAMAFGPEPLEKENFRRAINYKTLVSKLLADVEIVCDVPGAKVSLDGKELFVGPGRWSDLVPIGEHNVIARKQGYLPTNETRRFGPAEKVKVELKLFTLDDVTVYRRRWSVWKPLVVLGGGVAVLAAGGIIHASAASSMSDFNDGIAECGGCVPDSDLASKRDSARSKETIAYVTYAAGISTLAVGAVLAYMNREKPYRDESAMSGVAIVPTFSGDSTGVAAILSF